MRKLIIVALFFSVHAVGQESLVNDAQSSFLKGELFNALRYYSYATDQKISLSYTDISNYVTTKQILTSNVAFESFCKNLTGNSKQRSMFAIECGAQLIKSGKYEAALTVLDTVPSDFESVRVLVLKATASLSSSKRDQCLSYMEKAIKISKITLEDSELRSVSQARCLLMISKFGDATKAFHGINARSPYYISSLEEQAWTHFKRRDLDSARELLNVLASVYESNQKDFEIPDGSYFRSRYLSGYIELLTENSEKSKKILKQLSTDLVKYKTRHIFTDGDIRALFREIREVDNIAILRNKRFQSLGKIREFVFSWDRIGTVIRIDDGIRYIIALNKEIKQIGKAKIDMGSYKTALMKIRQGVLQDTAQVAYSGILNSQKTIESLLFKSNMGQLENFWAERTEGKRTLAEVIEDYKFGVMQVEDYLGK